MPRHVSSTFAHHQEAKIAFHCIALHYTGIIAPIGVMIREAV